MEITGFVEVKSAEALPKLQARYNYVEMCRQHEFAYMVNKYVGKRAFCFGKKRTMEQAWQYVLSDINHNHLIEPGWQQEKIQSLIDACSFGRKLCKQFNSIKKESFPWIYESPKDANQYAFINLQNAYTRFYKGISKHPQFKKKGRSTESYYIRNDRIYFNNNYVKVPLIGWIKMTQKLRFDGKIMSATISRQADKWFISIAVELENYTKERSNDNIIAVDLGIKTFAVDQNGTEYIAPKPLKNKLEKLARYQRRFCRSQKGSKNRDKKGIKVAKIHKQISDIRKDFTHKFTSKLCRENQSIIIEDLNLKGWSKMFGKSGVDGGVGMTRQQLKYKSLIYGNNLVVIDKWIPTSKSCSNCGCIKDLKLSDRIYKCDDCGFELDRDHNAARNIFTSGMIEINKIGMACPEFTPLNMEPLCQDIDESYMVELGNELWYDPHQLKQAKKKELEASELKLKKLVSEDTRTAMEIDEIANLLK